MDPLSITIEQQKLLASALRIKLLHTLKETPRTVKQVADLLGETPGNIHYHIKRLEAGNLLELVETKAVGGIMEKYYRSFATVFQNATPSRPGVETQLFLSQDEINELKLEVAALLEKWESRTAFRKHTDAYQEISVQMDFIRVESDK